MSAIALILPVLIALFAASSVAHAATPRPRATSATSTHKEPAIHLKLIGASYTPVYTDGMRWVVYEPSDGVTRITDTVKGTSTTRPDPEGCSGGLLAIGGGEILYACSDAQCPEAADGCLLKTPESFCNPTATGTSCRTVMEPSGYETGRWIVEDIASGAEQPLDTGKGLPASPSQGFPGEYEFRPLSAIGSQWAAEGYAGGLFVNWRTGRVVFQHGHGKEGDPEAGEEPASASREYENLNSETLLAPLCRPLERGVPPSGIHQYNGEYFSSSYAPPFMVEEHFKLSEVNRHVYLRRCGSSREELIPEDLSGGGWKGPIGADVLTGYERLWRLNLRGRPWLGESYRLVGTSRSSFHTVGHTSTMVFEAVARRSTASEPQLRREGEPGERGPELYAIWASQLPWVRARR